MKNIILVLALLLAVMPAATAQKIHDRNATPVKHRSPYVPPKKTGPKQVSINDRLKKLEGETAKGQTAVPAKKNPVAAVPKSSATDQNKPINFKSSKQRATTVNQKATSIRSTGRRSGMPRGRGY